MRLHLSNQWPTEKACRVGKNKFRGFNLSGGHCEHIAMPVFSYLLLDQ